MTSITDREKLSGFFRFAQGVLAAWDQVILRMRDTGLGCFLESEIAGLPGLSLNVNDESWLVLQRLRESQPPLPEVMLAEWLDGRVDDPNKPPVFLPVIVGEVDIEEASDLCEAELLDLEDIGEANADGFQGERKAVYHERVKVVLRLERLQELRAALDAWRDGPWETWAVNERPVRKSIQLYNALFKLHNMLHGGIAATPPELVWGMGLARWKLPNGLIDMPLIEQLVDLEVQTQGTLVIRPRNVRPCVVMKPFLHLDVEGSGETQREVQALFATLIESDEREVTPFDTVGWENLLDLVARRLSPRGRHITHAALCNDADLKLPEDDLALYTTWAIYGRARSENLREQDLERLREKIDSAVDDSALPPSLRGYVEPAPVNSPDGEDDWGVTRTKLGQTLWTSAEAGQDGTVSGGRNATRTNCEQNYFFPLPYNEEQAQIINRLDSHDVHVVSVTGPPGTGKTHTIANIIGHFMATGRRVLVTARTAEAIAAVRDKLPDDLANLVIASVGADRESVKQLEDAIQRLYDDLVSLNVEETRAKIGHLEAQILQIDNESRHCDQRLAQIAQQNLAPLSWGREQRTAMEMAETLVELEHRCGWMTDRPTKAPPEGLDKAIERLRISVPSLGDDLAHLGVELPALSEIPPAAELIDAHRQEQVHRATPREDLSGQPLMARDTTDTDMAAIACHDALLWLRERVADTADWERWLAGAMIEAALKGGRQPVTDECVDAVWKLIEEGSLSPGRLTGRVEGEDLQSLLEAAARGRNGKPPVPPLARIFGRKLLQAVESIRIDGAAPQADYQWAMVYDALKVLEAQGAIQGYWQAEAESGRLPTLPELPEHADELVSLVREVRGRISALRETAVQAVAQAEPMKRLFPFGLDVDGCLVGLDTERLLRALRANMKDAYVPPAALGKLKTIAARDSCPLFQAIGLLADHLGSEELLEGEIIRQRNAITEEISRLQGLRTNLTSVESDLQALREAGAPQWAAACLEKPHEVPGLLPLSWREAWDWAVMRRRIDEIIQLGNGDVWREKKIALARQRGARFEQLIRARTLLGLRKRMTGPVQSALAVFTTSVRRLGRGTGKSAGRWRTAIRKAAMEAAPAVPVWVMPEHKIAEQLPPMLVDFDLVILDEASQSDVTAVAALARGKKHLIVGDEQQVSPAAVGIPQAKIDVLRAEYLGSLPNRHVIDAGTSIFEVVMQMFPHNHLILREHFRCAEPIIQFSTRFYNGRLTPLRVPKASERFDPPLVDVFVKGAARRGKTNEDEARFIVDEIAAIAGDPAHARRDVAVISLIGGEQAELIERMLMEDPRVGTETMERLRIVCGDSRTMQGQERSVVFLSMVATPDTAVSQTTQDATQRFNVAVSRARDRSYLVRSVSAEDLQPSDLKRAVIEHFADPMPEGHPYSGQTVLDRCASGFEREVCQLLINANYRVLSQVRAGPFRIDLVVEGADDRRLAIELDGDAWHGPDKWDQDMARQAALERAGWTFWRVFGSQWVSEREYWWNNLLEHLRVMGIEPIGAEAAEDVFTEHRMFDVSIGAQTSPNGKQSPAVTTPADVVISTDQLSMEVVDAKHTSADINSKDLSADDFSEGRTRPAHVEADIDPSPLHSTVVPAATGNPSLPPEPGVLDLSDEQDPSRPTPGPSRFYDDSYRETLRSMVWDIVDKEGPITSRHLSERIARLHGFQRTGSQIKATVHKALKNTRSRSHGNGDDSVIWPRRMAISEWVPFRGLISNGDERNWIDVPLPEKLGLARMILEKRHPDPINAMRETIGLARLGTRTRSEIEGLLERARSQLATERNTDQRLSNVLYLDGRDPQGNRIKLS